MGVHDLGGMHGFGAIDTVDEMVFHDEWEGRTFGLEKLLFVAGLAESADEVRQSREWIGQSNYLRVSYYERWLRGFEIGLVARGIVSSRELRLREAAVRAGTPIPVRVTDVDPEAAEGQMKSLREMIERGSPSSRRVDRAPAFRVGQRVRVLRRAIPTHTRCPRYVWDRLGTVSRVHGAFVLPDTNAIGAGENPEYLYAVSFTGNDLWDDEAESASTIIVDLFELYMRAADAPVGTT